MFCRKPLSGHSAKRRHQSTFHFAENEEHQKQQQRQQQQQQRQQRRLNTAELARVALEQKILLCVEKGLKVKVTPKKGRGIFAGKGFRKGDFVCEYAGELIELDEAKERELEYEKDPEIGSYMYFFEYKSKKYCIDATEETDRLGRLLNHSKTESNVNSKIFAIDDVPHIILRASVNIARGEELLYDYGDRRRRIVDDHSWLAK